MVRTEHHDTWNEPTEIDKQIKFYFGKRLIFLQNI